MQASQRLGRRVIAIEIRHVCQLLDLTGHVDRGGADIPKIETTDLAVMCLAFYDI
jgi:hypothetical protein